MPAASSPPTVPISYYEDLEKPIDYKYYLLLLQKNFNLIFTFLVIGATLLAIHASRLPDQYRAEAQILLERSRGMERASPQMVMPDIWFSDYYNTQKEIMVGPTVLRQVVDELKLVDHFKVPDAESAVGRLRRHLKVDQIRESRLFNIVATTSSSEFSASLANATARAYIRKNFEDLLYFSKEILTWLPQEGQEMVTIKDPLGEVKQITREEFIKTLPSVQTDPTLRALRQKMTDLEAELTTLLKQYREKHPVVVKAQANLRFLEESIATETERVIESLKQQAAGQTQVSNARIVEEARVPRGASGPARLRMVVSGVSIELFVILLIIFLWDYFDDTIHAPEDLRRKGIPIAFLGPVPYVKPLEIPEAERFLIAHYHRRTQVAESFRYLRVAINFSAPAEKLKTLVFTSSVPGEGKSFVAHNIAISLAQDGNRTLIIDSDLRKPVAQRVYQVEKNLAGLSNYLTSDIELDTIVRETFIENLSVILSGPISPNPSEILASERMKELLTEAPKRFDRVLIDTPPITGIGDALILGAMTTHLIFVIRASKTPADVIKHSKETLEKSGIRIIGAVLNQIDLDKERYGGYYKYYYQSYSYYEKPSSKEV